MSIVFDDHLAVTESFSSQAVQLLKQVTRDDQTRSVQFCSPIESVDCTPLCWGTPAFLSSVGASDLGPGEELSGLVGATGSMDTRDDVGATELFSPAEILYQ